MSMYDVYYWCAWNDLENVRWNWTNTFPWRKKIVRIDQNKISDLNRFFLWKKKLNQRLDQSTQTTNSQPKNSLIVSTNGCHGIKIYLSLTRKRKYMFFRHIFFSSAIQKLKFVFCHENVWDDLGCLIYQNLLSLSQKIEYKKCWFIMN